MKKILGLSAALCLVVASVAMACPKDGEKSAGMTKCSGAQTTMAANSKGGGSCEGMASMKAGGTCSMSASECAAKMKHVQFSVKGLNSEEAASKVKMALAKMKGVEEVTCDLENCTATVCYKGTRVSSAVAAKLNAAGYRTAVSQAHAACPHATLKTSAKASKTT